MFKHSALMFLTLKLFADKAIYIYMDFLATFFDKPLLLGLKQFCKIFSNQ